ncbi:hypothetical protein KSP39_PZI014553 [Platanthera zijinensis]|uniref:OTU domain-containing protein n=1 Tax=Platanthera zijinensis TaxID=2320716 RepID=A0AAP0BAP6_9ASPA
MKRKLREFIDPSCSKTVEPLVPMRLKGRPKGSYKKFQDDTKSTKCDPSYFEHILAMESSQSEENKMKKVTKLNARKRARYQLRTPSQDGNLFMSSFVREQLPSLFSEHIIDVVDVQGDGHCGFRAISQGLNLGKDWMHVRNNLQYEILNHATLYDHVYDANRRQQLIDSLDCTITPAPVEKWMSLPDMGLVIASFYNVAVVQLSRDQCFTFLPLHSIPPTEPKLISIGFINGNHFVALTLRDNCPLPPLFSPWKRFHEEFAQPWESTYMSRIILPPTSIKNTSVIGLEDF